jgi:hypothetical protein
MILPPIYGAIQTYKDGLEYRYVYSFLGLAGKCSIDKESRTHARISVAII